ncbi:MAG: ribulose-phosphate 3-epimerase [Anaerolineales bacterium]
MKHTHPIVIAPSILSADFLQLGEALRTSETAGADWIHVDVMDGHFVPNLTMGPFIVAACKRATRLPLDVHLMITQPESLLEAFAEAGASHLTVHVETCPDLPHTLEHIKALGCKAGVTLRPGTPVEALFPALPVADVVLVMCVEPGYSGQAFQEGCVARVAALRRKLDEMGSPAWLEVDGGISPANLPRLQAAGADAFVSATAVFKHPRGIVAGIRALRQAARPDAKQ